MKAVILQLTQSPDRALLLDTNENDSLSVASLVTRYLYVLDYYLVIYNTLVYTFCELLKSEINYQLEGATPVLCDI